MNAIPKQIIYIVPKTIINMISIPILQPALAPTLTVSNMIELKHNTSVANSNFNSFNNNGHNTYLNHQSQNSYNLQTPMCLTVLVLLMQTAIHYKICTMDLIDDIV